MEMSVKMILENYLVKKENKNANTIYNAHFSIKNK